MIARDQDRLSLIIAQAHLIDLGDFIEVAAYAASPQALIRDPGTVALVEMAARWKRTAEIVRELKALWPLDPDVVAFVDGRLLRAFPKIAR